MKTVCWQSVRHAMLLCLTLVTCLTSATEAFAEDSVANPVNRFLTSKSAGDQYSYWPNIVQFGVIGEASEASKMLAASTIAYLANLAGAPTKMVIGNGGSAENNSDESPLNYLMFFTDEQSEGFEVLRKGIDDATPKINVSSELNTLLSGTPEKLGEGCQAGMSALNNGTGAIAAFIGIVDLKQSAELQAKCIRSLVSLSLGVYPVLNSHELFFGPEKKRILLLDESELTVSLIALRTCGENLHSREIRCPAAIVNNIFKSHLALVSP